MKSSIVLEYYHTLSKVVLNRFSLFVASPYFNKHEPSKKLHYYLLKETQKQSKAKLEKKIVFKAIFSNEKYKEQKLKQTISSLLNLFELFMVNEGLKTDKATYNLLYVKEALNKKIEKNTKRFVKGAHKDKIELSQIEKYLYKHRLFDLEYTYSVYYDSREASAQKLQSSIDYLDKFYFAEKLLIGASLANRKRILKTEFEEHFFDEIESALSKNKAFFEQENVIHINHLLYLLQTKFEEKHYFKIKELLQNTDLINFERRIYFTFLTNFCVNKINSGNENYLREYFDLNNHIIKNRLHLENNILSEWNFMNLINTALRLNEFEWAEDFLATESEYLNEKKHDNAFNYNSANIAYHKKDYDKAFTYLIDVEYTDIFYIMSSKVLLLKIYFETNEDDALASLLHSFRLLAIRQSKLSKNQKDMYLRFIKYTKLIFALKQKKISLSKSNYSEEKQKIDQKINTDNEFTNRNWVLNMLRKI